MHFSINFDRKGRLLTGLKLVLISSRPTFLSRGFTSAIFQLDAKTPWPNDTLTSFVMNSTINGAIFFNRFIGISSSSQDLDGILVMTFKTSSEDIGLKEENVGTADSDGSYSGKSSRSFLIFCIFPIKNSANSLASSSSSKVSGSGFWLAVLVRLAMSLYNFLVSPLQSLISSLIEVILACFNMCLYLDLSTFRAVQLESSLYLLQIFSLCLTFFFWFFRSSLNHGLVCLTTVFLVITGACLSNVALIWWPYSITMSSKLLVVIDSRLRSLWKASVLIVFNFLKDNSCCFTFSFGILVIHLTAQWSNSDGPLLHSLTDMPLHISVIIRLKVLSLLWLRMQNVVLDQAQWECPGKFQHLHHWDHWHEDWSHLQL